MLTYIIRRLLQAILIIFLVSLIVFFTMRLLPGDPILMIVTSSSFREYTEQQITKLRHEYGLDKPLIVQYLDFAGGILRGDFGVSIYSHRPVAPEIVKRALISVHIGILSWIIGHIIGIPMGIIAAMRRGTWLDSLVVSLSNIGITVPSFWLGMMLVYLFGLRFGWLPTMGYTSPFDDFWQNMRQIIMPVACLTLSPISGSSRQTRSSLLEVMHQDYIRTAWSKGLRERVIVVKHALRNALIPVVTLAGVHLSIIIGGEVIIEMVFNIPGMGRLLVTSITNQDYPYVECIVLLIAASIVLINLLVDLSYGWLDPRVRYN
jgi:peptide/nickel transport system permease protein